jgi:hypothetical protein
MASTALSVSRSDCVTAVASDGSKAIDIKCCLVSLPFHFLPSFPSIQISTYAIFSNRACLHLLPFCKSTCVCADVCCKRFLSSASALTWLFASVSLIARNRPAKSQRCSSEVTFGQKYHRIVSFPKLNSLHEKHVVRSLLGFPASPFSLLPKSPTLLMSIMATMRPSVPSRWNDFLFSQLHTASGHPTPLSAK